MPWLHCGATLLDDLCACPKCGVVMQSTKVLALVDRSCCAS